MPRFLTEAEVLSLHEAAIHRYGGSTGVRDTGLLASALSMPQQGFGGEFAHSVPFGLAAAYAFHICKNHPFVDGNKRTAFAACATFLYLNGWELTSADDVTADQILAIAEGRLQKSEFAEWLVGHGRARPSVELRDFFTTLSGTQLIEKLQAVEAPGRRVEMEATAQEAALAIPAVRDLLVVAQSHYEKGDEAGRAMWDRLGMLLVALYRIAEDAGYEW